MVGGGRAPPPPPTLSSAGGAVRALPLPPSPGACSVSHCGLVGLDRVLGAFCAAAAEQPSNAISRPAQPPDTPPPAAGAGGPEQSEGPAAGWSEVRTMPSWPRSRANFSLL